MGKTNGGMHRHGSLKWGKEQINYTIRCTGKSRQKDSECAVGFSKK